MYARAHYIWSGIERLRGPSNRVRAQGHKGEANIFMLFVKDVNFTHKMRGAKEQVTNLTPKHQGLHTYIQTNRYT